MCGTDEISMEKNRLINEVIGLEYEMFSRVENIGGRASCQDDYKTFFVMRYAQHALFSGTTMESLRQDLLQAKDKGRNLAAEKYSWMMAETAPDYFKTELEPALPRIGAGKQELIDRMTAVFMTCHEALRDKYPHLLDAGRTPYGGAGGVSIRTYFTGELKTWSVKTLQSAGQDLIALLEAHKNPVEMIYCHTAYFCGYGDLKEAEDDLAAGIIWLN